MTDTQIGRATLSTGVAYSSLQPLFDPAGIAVIGASADPHKLGGAMAATIARYSGHIALVNPRGQGMHASVAAAAAAAPGALDLAIVCVPASATPQVLAECGAVGVRAALVCAGGFAEAGGAGVGLQSELIGVAADHGIRLLGPNTSGFFVPETGLLASFVPGVASLRPGRVGLVAASGGLNHALAFSLQRQQVGVRLGVGIGAGVDVGTADVVEHLTADPSTTAIALHIEQVPDGPRLLAAVRAATQAKPVVALVVGQADVGDFARSHTGALATSWRTTRALLRQAGAVVVDDVDALVSAVAALSRTRAEPRLRASVGLVTGQAGPGLIVTDTLRSAGVLMPFLTQATTKRLGELLPPMTYQANPVDTGRPGPGHDQVVAATAADPNIDVVGVYGLTEPVVDLVGEAIALRQRTVEPLVVGLDGPADDVDLALAEAERAGVALAVGPHALAVALRALVEDAALRAKVASIPSVPPPPANETVGPSSLTESEAKDLLDSWGIATPPRRVCRSVAEACTALADLGAPVALKISDASVLHKSDVGGVRLGLRTVQEVEDAYAGVAAAGTTGEVLVERMSAPGVDLIVSARRDPVFGPVVLVGVGGTATEVYSDVAVAAYPASPAWLVGLADELTASTLLDGHRGTRPVDRNALARVLTVLGDALWTHPEIDEIELNPLRATEAGLLALDAVLLAGPAGPGVTSPICEGADPR